MSWTHLGLVMFGGAIGSGARHLLGIAAERLLGGGFPWGTLVVNVVGSAALGALWIAAPDGAPRLSAETRLLWGTGLLGGFTTYSTFNAEVLRALQGGAYAKAAAYLALTVAACLAGAWLGQRAASGLG